jgi:hypothetical protein
VFGQRGKLSLKLVEAVFRVVEALKSLFGTPSSPGRPEMSASQERIQRYRSLGARMRRSWSRSVQPAPRMPRPDAAAPTAPEVTMPRPSA